MRALRSIVALAAACLLVPAASLAQEYPSRAVRIVVPYPPGGGVDGMARPLAERLSRLWGKPAIVENKPGASTIIGTDFVAKSAPDGLTLLFTSDSSVTSNPHLFASLPFDPLKDLAPVTQLIDLHQMVVVHPSVPASSMRELVELAKAQPDRLNYGSYGPGSQPNLLFEALKVQTGARITAVSYKGIAPALTATLAGEVQMTLGGAATSGAHLASGRLKALAIARPARLPSHPDIPTLREAGFPDIDPQPWFGLFAPAGTPKAIVDKLRNDVVRVLADPEFLEREMTSKGYTPVGNTPEQFGAFIRRDFDYKRQIIKASGIKAD